MDGSPGTVLDGRSLFAIIEWDDGRSEEVHQFDPRVVVTQRAEGR